jgi:tetratricopeptide (TPR) repeat protein
VGKSTLVNKWLERLAPDNYRGARRVYGWSFYSQGTGERVTSADQFIAAALEWFGDADPTKGSPWDKGERLAELVRQQKTLLILDGMEPLQSDLTFEHGKIKDPGLAVLVAELARKNNGLCVITTREPVADLQEAGSAALQKNLEQISAQAGRALLRVGGIHGTDTELEKATADFGNHALAINLLAACLHDIPGHHISHSREIPDLDIPEAKGRHPRRVMAAFEQRWGESPAVQVLRILGLFDRPAELAAVEAVRRPPAIAGLTDQLQNLTEGQWPEVLENLRQHKLLAPRSGHNLDILDCHPLVREHFGKKLKANNPAAWKEAHSRLYDYYKSLPEKLFQKYLPDTLEEMAPLYATVIHGCEANHYSEALMDVYQKRIRRGDEGYSWRQLGAFGADLAVLSYFFDPPWDNVTESLNDNERRLLLGVTSFSLWRLGRLSEAIQPMKAGIEANIKAVLSGWLHATRTAGNLSELFLIIGDLREALRCGNESVEYAGNLVENDFERVQQPCIMASVKHQMGELLEARKIYDQSEDLQKKREPGFPLLHANLGFKYCNLLLELGDYESVYERAIKTLEWAENKKIGLLAQANDRLSLGRALLMNTIVKVTNEFEKAINYLDQAVRDLRKANSQYDLPRGLLARAELYRVKKDFAKSQRDLDEAFTIATRGGMRLHEADCHLEYARLFLAMGEKDKARESLAKAKKMIEEMGYHRRDPEIHLIEAQFRLISGEKDKTRESLVNAKELIDKMGMHRWDFEVEELEKVISEQ